jgi:site-specific recombinase XerD
MMWLPNSALPESVEDAVLVDGELEPGPLNLIPRGLPAGFIPGQPSSEAPMEATLAPPGQASLQVLGTLLPSLFEEAPVRDIFHAFARFLEIDVANGDATEDTIRAYRREVKCFAQWCFDVGFEPQRAQRRHIEAYREHLKARGLSATTRSHKLSIVRRFYEAAVKHGLMDVNPAQRVRGGKDLTPPEEKIKALSTGALSSLVAHVPASTLSGARDRAIIGLMAVHGLRRVEVHRLDHESLHHEDGAASLLVQGKGNRIRRVHLRRDTYNAIQNYANAKAQIGWPTQGALFLSHSPETRGQRISRRGLNWIVDKYLSGSALKRTGVSCHALRHTFGTLAVAGGAKIEHLKDAMGHSSIETTSLYVKAVERAKNNPANFIDVEI